MWLSRVTSSRFSLELVLYCICMHIYSITFSSSPSSPSSSIKDQLAPVPADLYQAPPTLLIHHVIMAVKSHDLQERWSELQPWVDLLVKYQRMLADQVQAETLLDLGLG